MVDTVGEKREEIQEGKRMGAKWEGERLPRKEPGDS